MGFIKAVVILACFVAFQYAFCEDCSRGEQFWCSSLKQSLNCSAFSHCKNTVWKNEIPKEDPSETCQFCEAIIKDVVELLKNNKSMDFIETFLTTVCDLIPGRRASEECKILVKEGLPYIIHLIQEKMDPKVICGLLGLCKNQFYSVEGRKKTMDEHFYVKENEKVMGICEDCHEFVEKARDSLLSKETEKKVIDFVENTVCRVFIIGKDKCNQLTEKFIPQIFENLRKNFDPDKLCFIFCNKEKSHQTYGALERQFAKLIDKSKTSFGAGCAGCNFISSSILNMLAEPGVKEAVIDLLSHDVCSLFSDDGSQECREMAKDHGVSALDMISKHLDTNLLCGKLGSCDPVDEKPAITTEADANRLGDKCETCQIVAQYLEALIETDAVVEQIERIVSRICTLLPGRLQSTCNGLIEEYGNLIIHYIAQYASPKDICKFLNLCPGVKDQMGEHSKCRLGPKFWCSTPGNAKLCLAEEHCKKFVWA